MIPPEAGARVCSAKGCRRDGRWMVRWNNPKVHAPDRRKIWLACEEHREYLSDFLSVRGFLCDVVAFADDDLSAPSLPADG